ncbi:MAG: DUF3971 domain-containing protein [Rhodobacterales bacterium]
MSAKRDETTDTPAPRSALGKWLKRALYMVMGGSFLLVVATGALFYRLKSGPLELPGVQQTVEKIAKKALSDFDVRVGTVSIVAAKTGLTALIQLDDLQIFTKTGQKIAAFPIMRAKLDPVQSMLNGLEIETIEIVGAEFRVLRDKSGKYNILPPGVENTEFVNPEIIFNAANKAARKAPISSLKLIDMIDTRLTYIDQLKSRVWHTSKTFIRSEREGNVITAFADVVMTTKDHADTSVGLRFNYGLAENYFGFGFKFDKAPTVDLADQVPALDWLRSFDALMTGSLNAEVNINGTLNNLSGVLQTDKGQLRNSPEAVPVKFSNIKTYFEYAKETDSLKFTQITAKSAIGNLTGDGDITMFRNPDGSVRALTGSLALSDLQVNPAGVFSQPVVFNAANVDLEMTLSPFSVTLKKGRLVAGNQSVTMVGSSVAGDKYWESDYYMRFNEISRDEVLKLWPLKAKIKTRTWIEKNILAGVAKNGIGQFHAHKGKLKADLKFDIKHGKVRYLKTLPVLQEATGRGHLTEKTFKVDLDSGYVIAKQGGRAEASRSSLFIPDITIKNAIGNISLNLKSSVRAALSLLDEKPFEYLKKANLKTNLGTGAVVATGTLKVPLKKGTDPKDVKFNVTATITNFASTKLVKGRKVTADKVDLKASDKQVVLSGLIKLDGLPTQTRWVLPIGKKYRKKSQLVSQVALTEANLRQFGLVLDKGMITGSAPAQMRVQLQPNTVPKYTLTSDMAGMGLNISSLNWKKPKKSKGKLVVSGMLGDNFTIDKLTLATAGLTADGVILFDNDSRFKRADFTSLKVGKWLDANVSIIGKGPNSNIVVHSGTADLRNISFSKGASTGAPMDVTLDRLIMADAITLTGFQAKLTNRQGLRGTYNARVNGGAPISGTIFPQRNGTAAEVDAVDAGAVLRSANLYSKGEGGKLRMIIVPLKQQGYYHGTFTINNVKVKQDNALASIFNAISVIGLVQQVAGAGIVFEKVDGQFTLKPQGVEIRKTSAVGVSVGMTLDGNYNSETKQVKFEGVLTPLYAVNGTLRQVFGKLFGRRKGEGLFGFVYKVSGTSSDPKISVNPLSILTPGIFRELFRTPMPDVGKADVSGANASPAAADPLPQTKGVPLTLDVDR